MADLRSATAPALGVTNPLVADVKRSSEADNGGFVDVMLARLTALNHNDDDLKDIIKYQDSLDASVRPAAADYLKNLHGVKPSEKEEVKVEAAIKPEIKEKIKARVREVMSQDTTPVKDDRAQKLLKKVAQMLLKANENGEIKLPKELVAKLQDFVDKDPSKMAAGEVALVMRDLIETFKTLNVSQDVQVKDAIDAMKWPTEMVQAFKELGLHPGIEADKPLTTMDALRALKSLVNLSENNALSTLSEKKQALIEMIDPDHVLLGLQPESEKGEAAAAKAKNSAVPQAIMDLLNKAEPAAVTAATQAAVAPQVMPQPKADKSKLVMDAQAAIAIAPVADAKVAVTAAMAVPASKTSAKDTASQAFDKGMLNAKFDKASPRAEMPAAPPVRSDAAQMIAASAKPLEAAVQQAPVSHAAPVADVNALSGENMSTRFGASTANAVVKAAHLPPSPAAQQVMVNIQQKLNGGGSQLSVQLTPVELGRVDMRVTFKADGTAHTVVTVDRPETLTLMQKDAVHLERALQQAGLNANQENMSFNLREQRQAQQGFGQHRKRALRDGDDAKIQEVALNVHDGRIISDNRVNYHA